MNVHDDPSLVLPRPCWKCGAVCDGHARVGGDAPAVPKDGDIAVCAYCASPGKYQGEAIVPLSGEEFASVMRDERFRAAYDAIRYMVSERS